MSLDWSEGGVRLSSGETIALHAADLLYWQHDRKFWPGLLAQVQAVGLQVVRVFVPWGPHEEQEGPPSFSGNLDLGYFLDQVQAAGMHAIVSLGPSTALPLPLGGFPRRIVEDAAMATKTGRSTPLYCVAPPKMFPLPSYASTAFQAQVREWFSAVGQIVGPRMHDAGPVLATLVQAGQGAWRDGAFESDYHPDALQWWQAYSGGEDAPRFYTKESMGRCLRWMRFREEYMAKSYAWLCQAAQDAGMGPCGGHFAATDLQLQNVYQAMRSCPDAGLHIVEFGEVRSTYSQVRNRALSLGSNMTLPCATLPIGGPYYQPVRSEEQEKQIALGALAGGISTLHFSMLVEPGNWHGAAITEAMPGKGAGKGKWVAPLLAALKEVQFHRLRRQDSGIVVLTSRAEVRAGIVSSALELVPSRVTEQLQLGPSGHAELSRDESARLYPRWLQAVQSALDLAQLPYRLVDEECLHQIDRRTKAIVVPTLRRVDGAMWAGLHALARSGIQLVLGPQRPSEDELGDLLGVDAALPVGAGLLLEESLEDLEGLSADLLGLVREPSDLWIAPNAHGIELSVFASEDGQERALFIASRSESDQELCVNVPTGVQLRDALDGDCYAEAGGVVCLPMPGQEIRFFVVEALPN